MRPFVLLLALAAGVPAHAAPVAAPPTQFGTDQLLRQVQDDLARHFALDGDLQVGLLSTWSPPDRTASVWKASVVEYPEQASANMVVRVRIAADGAPLDEISLLLHAALWRDAWFAREPLHTGNVFDPGRLAAQRVDVFRQRDALPASAGDATMMFSRDVPADRMLTWYDLSRMPLVRKGEIVDAVASEGRLSVSMKAQALQNGAKGDLILVRNLESLKSIPAEVVGENRVEVHF